MRSTLVEQRSWTSYANALAIAVTIALVLAAAPEGRAGVVFSFGDNTGGQTGLGVSLGHTDAPTRIDASNLAGRSVARVAAGAEHSLLVAEDGAVFTFGGPLAHLGRDTSVYPSGFAAPLDGANLGGAKILDAGAGFRQSFLVSDDGAVFSFGLNSHGQVGNGGLGELVSAAEPVDPSSLNGVRVVQAGGGSLYSLLLSDDGEVFSFGDDVSPELLGRSVHGTDAPGSVPLPIDTSQLGGRTITQIAAGDFTSLLLADDGAVFSFGRNGDGQAGQGIPGGPTPPVTPIATPIDTTYLGDAKIVQVAAGGSHSLVLADDGAVYSFGDDSYGQLGRSTTRDMPAWVPTPIDATNLDGREVVDIAAGYRHSLLLADDGSVFLFGDDSFSGADSLPIATAVDLSALGDLRVTDLAAGNYFSLLVAVPEPCGAAMLVVALATARARKRRRA